MKCPTFILKMELFDFGTIQNLIQMLSHDKIIFHMLFRAFHVTSRISCSSRISCYLPNVDYIDFHVKFVILTTVL